ncbi:MAG: RIP metalloprotease RseP [Bdellovibrionota bacterium]
MDFILSTLQALPTGIVSFLLLLGLLIFVHELGHFAAAKYFGVRVETFSLGFGKKILQFKRGDTTYCISIIPLGGFVKMYGDDPTQEPPPEERRYSFLHQPVWPRIVIVLAGPLMNLFFAIFLFFILGVAGETVAGPQIGDIDSTTAAYSAGFRSGDTITAINGAPVRQWKEIKESIEDSAGQDLKFTVNRADGTTAEVTASPNLIKNPFIFSSKSEVGTIAGLEVNAKISLVGVSDAQSPAAKAGFTALEQIEEINGQKVLYWRELTPALEKALADKAAPSIKFKVRSYVTADETQEPPLREVEIPVADAKGTDALAALGFKDPQTFLLSVKKGSPGLTLKAIAMDSPASKAGLQSGDELVRINDTVVTKWDEVLNSVKNYKESEAGLSVTFRRKGEEKTVNMFPELTELPTQLGGMDKRYAIGIVPAVIEMPNPPIKVSYGPGEALVNSVKASYDFSVLIGMSILRLVQAEVSPRNIGGVITIGRVASQSFQAGWDIFIKTMAVISINIFLLNLLPVPVLDGGHLLFFVIEAIKGSPISLKKMMVAQQVGMVLLLCLMVFALFNDLTHWVSSR